MPALDLGLGLTHLTAAGTTVAGTQTAPTATLNVALNDRTVTASLSDISGDPAPTASLDTFTVGGADVSGAVTGAGTVGDPWTYVAPSSGSSAAVVVGASLSNGVAPDWNDTDSSLTIPADLAAPSPFGAGQFTWSTLATPAGDKLRLEITSMPLSGSGDTLRIEARLSTDGATYGAAFDTGLTGVGMVDLDVPAETQTWIQLRHVSDESAPYDESAWSAAKDATPTHLATAPDAFTVGMWTLDDSPSVAGDRLTLTVLSLPADGGSALTALEYQVDSGSGYGAAQTLSGVGTGARLITVLAETEASVQLRAVNANGAGPWSDVKTATPTQTTATADFTIRTDRDAGIIDADRRSELLLGDTVHFWVDESTLGDLAAEAGLGSIADLVSQTIPEWTIDSPGENYPYACLPATKRGLRSAGRQFGWSGAHRVQTMGSHTVTCSIRYGGSVWTKTFTISADSTRDAYYNSALNASAETAVLDMDGDFSTGIAYTPDATFTDPSLALEWLKSVPARFRRLIVRGDKPSDYVVNGLANSNASYTWVEGYGVPEGSVIEGLYSTTRPRFTSTAMDGLWCECRATGDGITTDFSAQGSFSTNIRVYVDDVEITAFTRPDGSTVRFNTAPAPGAVIKIVPANADNTAWKNNDPLYFLTLNKCDIQISGIEIDMGYRSDDATAFDVADLTTWRPGTLIRAIDCRDQKGHGTIYDCIIRGCRSGVSATFGMILSVVDCNLNNNYNYCGCYGGDELQTLNVMGCNIWQPEGTINFPGSKTESTFGVVPAPDHGSIRHANSQGDVRTANRYVVLNSWGSNALDSEEYQPFDRSGTGGAAGKRISISFCHGVEGGGVNAMGTPNEWLGLPEDCRQHWCNNYWEIGSADLERFSASAAPVTSINDVFLDKTGKTAGDLAIFAEAGGADQRTASANVATSGHVLINPTIVSTAQRTTGNLTLVSKQTLQRTGILNEVGRVVVSGTPTSVNISTPNEVESGAFGETAWRIYRVPAGDTAPSRTSFTHVPTATTQDTITARNAIYDAVSGLQERQTTVDVTLLTGTFQDGETVILCRCTLEADGNTFHPNNLATPVEQDAPTIIDPAIITVGGAWASVKKWSEGAAEPDPAAFVAATLGNFDEHYVPLASNALLGAGSANGWPLAWDGQDRPDPPALGAFELGTVVIPSSPAPSVTVADNENTYAVQLSDASAFPSASTATTHLFVQFVPQSNGAALERLFYSPNINIVWRNNNQRLTIDAGGAFISEADLVVSVGQTIALLVTITPGGAITVEYSIDGAASETFTAGTVAASIDLAPMFFGSIDGSGTDVVDMHLHQHVLVLENGAPVLSDFLSAGDPIPHGDIAVSGMTILGGFTAADAISGTLTQIGTATFTPTTPGAWADVS